MVAFDEVFSIQSADPDLIAGNIADFCIAMGIDINSKLEKDLLFYKITGMYNELADEDFQYTFDEHGEWLLSKLLLYMLDSYEGFLQYAEEEEPEEYADHMPSIEDFWGTSLSDDDIKYVEKFADDYFTRIEGELFEEDEKPEDFQEWLAFQKEMFIERVTYFPMMAFEITDEMTPEFLFWDRDFLLIDQFGKEEFENLKDKTIQEGNRLGFMAVSENTQMYTGSQKHELSDIGMIK